MAKLQKFPKGALSFYIELYCKRKSETKKKLQQEALKSWVSLSKSEKKFFETKYKEYQCNFKRSIAKCLKNAEPYLKSKIVIPNRRKCLPNVNCEEMNKEILQNELLISSKREIDDNEDCADPTQNEGNIEVEAHNSYHESPIPTSQTAKGLFLMIKEREENSLMWEELTAKQKRRYADALRAIKRDYLKQYREYLEHLPSEKLFDHYRNVINSV
ncbi:uncharacterized protein LOC123875365 isoform X2 [Maniola jurtina]|uniref:uncharacterized protein LOC123875365 isoform X2 n=1 Tax=Maniola jurtina TaxID=191418 RepID=UPI001E68A795|nr:uncharacterized protein LOC123875365 isoform X2 [Maniola jurtina]